MAISLEEIISNRFMWADRLEVVRPQYSDYFINPSVAETFGLTNLESLSCGTRPIVFKLPVFQETLSDWGIFVDQMDGRALAERIKESMPSKTTSEMRSAAHQYVVDKFSEDTMCSNFLSLYKEAIKPAQPLVENV